MSRSAMLSMKNMWEYSKSEDRLCWPKLIKTHKQPPKEEQILMLEQKSKLVSSTSSKTVICPFVDLFLHLLTLYFVSDTILGSGDRGRNKRKSRLPSSNFYQMEDASRFLWHNDSKILPGARGWGGFLLRPCPNSAEKLSVSSSICYRHNWWKTVGT